MSILAVVLLVVLVMALVGSWPGGPVVAHGSPYGWYGPSLAGVLLAVLVVLLLLRVI